MLNNAIILSTRRSIASNPYGLIVSGNTPQAHPEVYFTHVLGIYQSDQIDNQDEALRLPNYCNVFLVSLTIK